MSYLVSPLEAIKSRTAQDGTLVQYILNNTLISSAGGLSNILPVPQVCLVFLKTWASEGYDRIGLEPDWNSTGVVDSVASYCNNTIVITNSAGLNVMPWANNPNVTAILAAHLPGQESGNSIVDVLYGTVNPSGKLPYTIALNASDYNFAPITNSTALVETEDPNAWQSNFTEGLLIDYRHFDYYNQSVAFEFGFGLSYTTFDMTGIQIQSQSQTGNGSWNGNWNGGWNSSGSGSGSGSVGALPPPNPIVPGGNPSLWEVLYTVSVTVTNTGAIAGAAVPQVYLSLPQIPGEDPTPLNVLRGFDKVMLQPGESQSVAFGLMRRDLSYWNTMVQEWMIPTGPIGVNAGFSSRDFRQKTQLTVVS
jgi:beta-glucosidase